MHNITPMFLFNFPPLHANTVILIISINKEIAKITITKTQLIGMVLVFLYYSMPKISNCDFPFSKNEISKLVPKPTLILKFYPVYDDRTAIIISPYLANPILLK